jgi:hypothetical protein
MRKPIFVEPLDLGAIVGGNSKAGHAVHHLNRHKQRGLTWRTDGTANSWVRGDMGTGRAIDFCSMLAANALPGTTIRLRLGMTQAEVDGVAPYDSTALPFISPAITRDDGLYHSHLELLAVVNARWWRIDIAGHTGDFEAASLVLGKTVAPSRMYSQDYAYGIEDLGSIEPTRWGVFDETPGAILRTLSFTLAWQTEAEFEESFRPMMERLGKRLPIYCCFQPEANTWRQARTYLGILSRPPFATGLRKPQTVSQSFQILSVV